MPRIARELSETSIYHIMMRGNEKKPIFIDDIDRQRFIDILLDKKKEKEYLLFAYCLMDNHIHLAIKEGESTIGRTMKRINTSYAGYFNKKYNRVGHVFQDRFKSESINDDNHLLAAIRYIHNNPVKAGIVNSVSKYKWSSYTSYVTPYSDNLIDSRNILQYFSEDTNKAIKEFVQFSSQSSSNCFIDCDEDKKIDNRDLANIVIEKSTKGIYNKLDDKSIDFIKKDKALLLRVVNSLNEETSLSLRSIANLLRLDRNIVQRLSSKGK